jgi:hypothetical protein
VLFRKTAAPLSTKYGKIDGMTISLEAVLPQGEIMRSKTIIHELLHLECPNHKGVFKKMFDFCLKKKKSGFKRTSPQS